MRIGIIGAGRIGGTLASALSRAGHEVVVGRRSEPGSIDEAVQDVEGLVLALPGGDVDTFLRDHGAALDGVVVIDAANSRGAGAAHHAAAFAEHAPGALMVRAFNTLGWENFAEPTFGDERADLFWCGPEGRATEVAEQVIADVGLRPVRVGGPEAVDAVDAVLALWFALVTEHGNRRLAFRTLGLEG